MCCNRLSLGRFFFLFLYFLPGAGTGRGGRWGAIQDSCGKPPKGCGRVCLDMAPITPLINNNASTVATLLSTAGQPRQVLQQLCSSGTAPSGLVGTVQQRDSPVRSCRNCAAASGLVGTVQQRNSPVRSCRNCAAAGQPRQVMQEVCQACELAKHSLVFRFTMPLGLWRVMSARQPSHWRFPRCKYSRGVGVGGGR